MSYTTNFINILANELIRIGNIDGVKTIHTIVVCDFIGSKAIRSIPHKPRYIRLRMINDKGASDAKLNSAVGARSPIRLK